MNVAKQESSYWGNGQEDIELARNAHVPDGLIDRGEHCLIKIEPTLRISSLYELRDFLGV